MTIKTVIISYFLHISLWTICLLVTTSQAPLTDPLGLIKPLTEIQLGQIQVIPGRIIVGTFK